jgi:hypothetical protein
MFLAVEDFAAIGAGGNSNKISPLKVEGRKSTFLCGTEE